MAKTTTSLPRVVFFDLVGTLIHPKEPVGRQYARCAARFDPAADPERLASAFKSAMAAAPPLVFPGKSPAEAAVLERSWWKRIVSQVVESAGLSATLTGSAFDAFFQALFDHFATADAWSLFPDVLAAFAGLRARGVRLGLVTNYDSRVFALVEALGIAQCLESIIVPARVGSAKPGPLIFRRALEEMDVNGPDALHVGDELGDDYRGAERAGLRAVLLTRDGTPAPEGVRSIASLTDLISD